MLYGEEEEEEVEEGFEDEREEYPGNVGDDTGFDIPEDEQVAEEDEYDCWDEGPQEDNEYLYEAQSRIRPQPISGGRGLPFRGRRQQQNKYKAAATGHPRADHLGRGRGVATAPGRSSGLPMRAPRGYSSSLGPVRGRGMGAAARGRGPRVPPRYE